MVPVSLVVGSYWAAASFAWLLTILAVRTESRREIRGASIFWGVLLSPVAGLTLYTGGLRCAGLAALVWLVPVTRDLFALGTPRDLPPMYSRALAKRRVGDRSAAELEILRELEKREDDFEGWMILAELYARDFNEMAEAERVIHQLCSQPGIKRSQVCVAFFSFPHSI